MHKYFTYLFLGTLLFTLSSCATFINGPRQTVYFKSNEPAKVFIDGKARGTTPVKIAVRRKETIPVRLEKEGYIPIDYTLQSHMNNAVLLNAVTAALPIVGGLLLSQDPLFILTLAVYTVEIPPVIGVGIDYLSGGMFSYNDSCYFYLVRQPYKITDEKIALLRCDKVDFDMATGDRIGIEKTKKGKTKNILSWKTDLDIPRDQMNERANKELEELNYSPEAGEDSRYSLRAAVHIADYSIQEQRSEYTETRCRITTRWEIYDKQEKKIIYTQETGAMALEVAYGGDEVVKQAFIYTLYNLLNTETFFSM